VKIVERKSNAGRPPGPSKVTKKLRELYDTWADDHKKTLKLFDALFRMATAEGFDKTGKLLASPQAALGLLKIRFGDPKVQDSADSADGEARIVPILVSVDTLSPAEWRRHYEAPHDSPTPN
jgi:hypothetical protein